MPGHSCRLRLIPDFNASDRVCSTSYVFIRTSILENRITSIPMPARNASRLRCRAALCDSKNPAHTGQSEPVFVPYYPDHCSLHIATISVLHRSSLAAIFSLAQHGVCCRVPDAVACLLPSMSLLDPALSSSPLRGGSWLSNDYFIIIILRMPEKEPACIRTKYTPLATYAPSPAVPFQVMV